MPNSNSPPNSPPESAMAQGRESEIEQMTADFEESERIRRKLPIASAVGATLSIVAFVIITFLMYYFTRDFGPDVKPADGPSPAQKREEQKKADANKLGSYGWVDPAKGVARIPIDRAMELVVRDSSKP